MATQLGLKFVTFIMITCSRFSGVIYLYRCTVHFEDSLNITHQQMHQLYIIY